MEKEAAIYQRIGEFAVSFQWIENKLREIGWFILDPERNELPPKGLRNLTNYNLIKEVDDLFLGAVPKCQLSKELETDLINSFRKCVANLHKIRKDRNRIMHSAYIEISAGGDVQAIMRSNPQLGIDEETGETMFDQEILTPNSFSQEMALMGEIALVLNRAYMQLIQRYPKGGA